MFQDIVCRLFGAFWWILQPALVFLWFHWINERARSHPKSSPTYTTLRMVCQLLYHWTCRVVCGEAVTIFRTIVIFILDKRLLERLMACLSYSKAMERFGGIQRRYELIRRRREIRTVHLTQNIRHRNVAFATITAPIASLGWNPNWCDCECSDAFSNCFFDKMFKDIS